MAVWATAVGGAECLLLVNPLGGVILHAFIVAVLLGRNPQQAAANNGALALPSILRICSLALPWPSLPAEAWYPLLAVPTIAAAWLAMRAAGLSFQLVGLARTRFGPQALIASSGVPLGLALRMFLDGESMLSVDAVGSPVLLLAIATCVALPEELIFRGVLQRVLADATGRLGVAIVAIVYGTMYIGTLSAPVVVMMTGVGLLFGIAVRRWGSIIGTSAAHALMLVGSMIVFGPLS